MGTSRADWDQNPEVGGPKIGKGKGFRDSYYFNGKNQRARRNKPFENSMRVSVSKLHICTARSKKGLSSFGLYTALMMREELF